MIDPRRLRVLVEVARRGSISAAADALSFVPSAVSQQIDALEREAGVKLTARAGRGIVLTTAGRLLVDHGEDLLRRLAVAEDALRELDGLVGGRLRLASFQSAGATLVPNALSRFAREHSGVRLSLIEEEPAQSIPALKRHDVDLAVIYHYDFVDPVAEPGIEQRRLMTDEMTLVMPPDHRLASRGRVTLQRFAEDVWIVDHPGTSAYILTTRACRAAGFEPDIAYTTDDYLVALRLVAGGLGVSFVPTLALTGLHEAVSCASLRQPPGREVLAAWREDSRSEAVRVMVELLTDESARVGPAARATRQRR